MVKIKEAVVLKSDLPLTYPRKCLVGAGRIVFWDSKAKKVYLFNSDGTFISQVGERGNAQNEYNLIKDIAFNPDSTVIKILDESGILNYSMDERIYLATLNEYCYYPAIAISAPQDTAICAAAKGKITAIGYNEEIGQYVSMDLGDGYTLTYGQLKDVCTKQGDIVSRGQIIGNVADPTKYYALEGANLYVKMEHDGESMNPVLYFQ